jgi:hypothetical protein
MISCERELDIDNKLNNYLFENYRYLDHKKKPLKKTRIKLHNTLALPLLLYGSETWTIKARDTRRISAAPMKYMRRTAGYTWTDYKTNTQIAKELKITPILDRLLEYNRNWIQHVNRMPHSRLPRVMKHHSPIARRNHGRPLKRLLDMRDRNGSTSGPTPTDMMMKEMRTQTTYHYFISEITYKCGFC